MLRNELPENCLDVMPGEGKLIILNRGEKGYYPSDWETGSKADNKELADWHNHSRGINPAQVMAMRIGSMCGFDVPGADPQMYFDDAKHVRSYEIDLGGMIKDPIISLYSPVKGKLHQYQVAGDKVFYLEVSAMPENLMGVRTDFIILPDMVQGKPLVPVSAEWASNGICTMTLESGCSAYGKELNAGYQIIAKARVGPVEYVLGALDGKFPSFCTWERTPANDGDGPPNYYWGHYFSSRNDAIQDFCGRTSEKFEMLSEQRRHSVRERLAVKPAPGRGSAVKPKAREER